MSIVDYLDLIIQRLLSDPNVDEYHVVRQRTSAADGHIRVRLLQRDGSHLEFSEYVQRISAGDIKVITYSYHWSDPHDDLIRRWDNTPHFPHLPNFPHHIHDGPTGRTLPGRPTDIFNVLDQIAEDLR